MQAKTQSGSMQELSDQQFWLRVFASNPGHHPASSFSINDIGHSTDTRPFGYGLS